MIIKELEPIEQRFSSRFALEKRTDKTLLIQGVDSTLSLVQHGTMDGQSPSFEKISIMMCYKRHA